NAAARDRLDAIRVQLVVRAVAVRPHEGGNRVPPLEYPRIDVDAERRQRVEVGSPLLDLFVLRTHLASIFFLMASSMPLMNFTDSSVLKVRASSSASLMTTGRGVSGSRSSAHAAIRRLRRSITAIRSVRNFAVVS